jgi:hypothetical protein
MTVPWSSDPDDLSPEEPKTKKRKPRGQGPEAQRVVARLAGFDLAKSRAWKAITEQFTIGVTHAELKSIAQVVCSQTNLRLDRDAARDNRVLIKWFDENWDVIAPFMPSLHLRDEGEQIIGSPACLM